MSILLGDGAPVMTGDLIAPARNLFRERLLSGQPVRVLELMDDGSLRIDPDDGREPFVIQPDVLRHFRYVAARDVAAIEITFPDGRTWTVTDAGMPRLTRRYAATLMESEKLDVQSATDTAASRLTAGDERAFAWLRQQPWGEIELVASSPAPSPDPERAARWHTAAQVRPVARAGAR